MTYKAAIAGVLSGGIIVLIWKQFSGGIFDLYEIVPGFIISSLFILLISYIDKPPAERIIKEYESVEHQDI